MADRKDIIDPYLFNPKLRIGTLRPDVTFNLKTSLNSRGGSGSIFIHISLVRYDAKQGPPNVFVTSDKMTTTSELKHN